MKLYNHIQIVDKLVNVANRQNIVLNHHFEFFEIKNVKVSLTKFNSVSEICDYNIWIFNLSVWIIEWNKNEKM